ncbi:alpha/beta fold hydrolase [Pseudidiomarina taiwanensis]|uniref:Alpha/beta hydrolase n=1 Tax=Pseudidiomarina taiwanensis TaxID=337250 RepID=A0A432ZNP8_9GAMM|nr:alpha/beta fold hydrolase [Pseudidiomarina taiwanensis]RUO79507.1 alpha/beta hydrolase [Pseudidiomarina taiwanensis]
MSESLARKESANRVAIQRDNEAGKVRVVFAHGAGAGLQSDFMQYIALGLAMRDIEVVRFNFPYWQQFMDSGRRRPPNPMAQLEHAMSSVVEHFKDDKPLFLMGKSLGARVAFRIADQVGAHGAIALGFPFHPIGKPDKLRLTDLHNQCPQNWIIQGDRDAFGRPHEVRGYALPENVKLAWLQTGDHSLIPTKRSGFEKTQLWQAAIDHVAQFVHNSAL